MNLRDLQYLVALAETRHFRLAAERTNVSQPTLSGQIRKLEETLGVALFERDSRKVALTPAGAAVLSEARSALSHADAIREIASSFRDPLAGRLRLGVIASLGPFLAPDLLAQLHLDAPRLEVLLNEGLTDELLARLRAHELDAVLLATPAEGEDLVEMALFEEPFLIAHAPGHPLAAVTRPTLEDVGSGTLLLLSEGHCLRDQALSLCGTEAVDRRVAATSLVTLMRMAALGEGVTLVPALATRYAGDLALRPLRGEEASRRVRLLARRSFPRLGAAKVVAAAARAVAAGAGLACLAAA